MKNQTLGEMISTLRKEHSMTQADLAEKMNVTDKAVSKWERDLSCPDVNSLPKLAQTLEVSVDELMQVKKTGNGDGDKKKTEKIVMIALRAVALAMGVSVTVLSIVGELETKSAFTMLGIGLAMVAVYLLQDNTDTD